jgi:hypothetical protein
MNFKTLGICILCTLTFVCTQANAQDEFKAEIGGAGGGAFYIGDANTQVFKYIQPSYGGLLRYRFNQRIAGRIEFNATQINIPDALDPKDINVSIPILNPVRFLDFNMEFNFNDIAHNPFKHKTTRFTSYVFLGYGRTFFKYNSVERIKSALNFGVGIKYKLAPRWNFNAQWSNKLLNSDQVEGLGAYADPYGLNGTNILNKDFVSNFTVAITFDFWVRNCACRKTTQEKPKVFKH